MSGIVEAGEFRFLGYDEAGDLLLQPLDGEDVRAYPTDALISVPVNTETLALGTFVAVEPLVGGVSILREFCNCWSPDCLGASCREAPDPSGAA